MRITDHAEDCAAGLIPGKSCDCKSVDWVELAPVVEHLKQIQHGTISQLTYGQIDELLTSLEQD